MKKRGIRKIAVIRAIDLRLVQAEFASCFKKIKSVFISNYHGPIAEFCQTKGLEYCSLPLVPSLYFDPAGIFFDKPVNKSWLFFNQEKLEKILKGIDIFQIQEPYFIYSGQIAAVKKKLDKPLICAPWTSFLHPSTLIPPYSFSVRRVIRETDLFVVRSKKAEKDYLSYFKIPDQKKVLIYHGVNLERFYPAIKRQDEVIRILFAGQLTEHKGIDDLLVVFPKLIKAARRKVELVICGRGKYERKISEMAKTLPIKYLGYVDDSNISQIYRGADIFCGPSKDWYLLGIKRTEEGFGFVFLEAMATGLPVVTNDCGAIKEAVGEDNFLNRQGDQKGLLNSLLELINDSNLRRSIGIKNRKRVEKYFDLKKTVEEEEKVILEKFFGKIK